MSQIHLKINNLIFNNDSINLNNEKNSKIIEYKFLESNFFQNFHIQIKYKFSYFNFILNDNINFYINEKNDFCLFQAINVKSELQENLLNNIILKMKIDFFIYYLKTSISFKSSELYLIDSNNNKKILKFNFNLFESELLLKKLLKDFTSYENIETRIKYNESLFSNNIKFPYLQFRSKQKEVINKIITSLNTNKKTLIQLPTGFGKTICVLFSMIKKFNDYNKIFYLTSKETGKNTLEETIQLFNFDKYYFNTLFISSKDKICLNKNEEIKCRNKKCPFLKTFLAKKNKIIKRILLSDTHIFNKKFILDISLKEKVCPYELQISLIKFSKLIINDFNYVFDPISNKVFKKDYYINSALIIDESHNLINRVRNSYSQEFNFNLFSNFVKEYANSQNKITKEISNYFSNFYQFYIMFQLNSETNYIINTLDNSFINYLNETFEFLNNNDEEISKLNLKFLTTIYAMIERFLFLYSNFNEKFILFYNKEENILKILCLDVTFFINYNINIFKSICCLSGTLEPIDFYKKILFLNDCHIINLETIFDKNNLNLIINKNISIEYKDREKTMNDVILSIESFISVKTGNYFIYCPSFDYMYKIKEKLQSYFLNKHINIFYQTKDLTLNKLNDELQNKNILDNNLFLFVLGGSYSESININNHYINGFIIIGIGLPNFNYTNELISKFYKNDGFKYVYTYPGLNIILQTIGRIIRDEKDVGSILLIDKRYQRKLYVNTFSKISNKIIFVDNNDEIYNKNKEFIIKYSK